MSTPIDLERLLASAAAAVDWPTPPDVASRVAEAIRIGSSVTRPPRFRRRAFAFAATVVAVLTATLLISPGARRAIADLIGLGGVVIRSEPTPSASPPSLTRDLIPGEPVTIEQARSEIDWELKIPSALGDPDEVYVDVAVPDKAVSLVYLARPGLPEVQESEVGALLTQFRGRVGPDLIGKLVDFSGVDVAQVVVGDNPGYFVRGTHTVFYYDADGQFREDTLRLAGNTLIWTELGVTYRLETDLSSVRALAIAVSL